MKSLVKLSLSALIILGLLFTVGCEGDEEEDMHVLVGTWDLSNFEQSSSYVLVTDLSAYGVPAGTPLGSGALTWTEFSAMGVSATVTLNEDGTFVLEGMLPDANDTLGVAPSIVSLPDQGTWTAADDLSTLLIDGALYDLGGALTLDDPDAPTVISMAYSAVDTAMNVFTPDGTNYLMGDVQNTSSTVLGWTKQ